MCITLTDIKDAILIISSLTTISLALLGIKKWKKEFKAKQYHESARLLIKSLYSLRDSFDSVRSNWISVAENMPGYNPMKPNERENYAHVFDNRFKSFNESYSEFLSILPEIEISFGKEFRKKCGQINGQINYYHHNLTEFIQTADNKEMSERVIALRLVIFRQSKNDKFRDELVGIIDSIEEEIKDYLKL